ncbi:MAG: hypothetical protein PWP24_1197 [Clostridiales bacterium]|nr:hypothetical protein [Clostridiales bacterium]
MKYDQMVLFSDMDGTLLNNQSKVSEKNKEAIVSFVREGGHFGIATGRGPMNAWPYVQDLPINLPCIFYNGGAIYDYGTKRYLKICELPKQKLEPLFACCYEQFPQVMLQIYEADLCYIVSDPSDAKEEILKMHTPYRFCQVTDILDRPWIKLLLHAEKTILFEVENALKRLGLGDVVDWVFSSDIYLEILPKHASKGSLLAEIRRMRNKEERYYSVGDYNNDFAMLSQADVGIAVSNAVPVLKEAADVITVSNEEDAIADIIYRIM